MGDFGETINTTTIADETDVLIVGAGPSGTSLGSFLGLQGIEGLIISEKPCPPSHPRANYLHMAGLECLREIGLEEKARAISYPVPEYSTWTRLVETMTGEEVYRAHVFGNSPHRKGEYYDASPSEALCLCQTDLEPPPHRVRRITWLQDPLEHTPRQFRARSRKEHRHQHAGKHSNGRDLQGPIQAARRRRRCRQYRSEATRPPPRARPRKRFRNQRLVGRRPNSPDRPQPRAPQLPPAPRQAAA
ncbi:UbiH 2-polyprenyl-6-methoxyphenol hydroxylase [Pyrenophora tritici-repentis]|nr:UbiH 2-polyprenyl-6-methoxyphenol hydroxylase [Pyrenophora tritici-repentis]